MAEQTTTLKLSKPSLNDGADIRVLNTNFDIIDDAISKLQSPSTNPNEYLRTIGGTVNGDVTITGTTTLDTTSVTNMTATSVTADSTTVKTLNVSEDTTFKDVTVNGGITVKQINAISGADELNINVNGGEFCITKDNIFINDKSFVSLVENGGDANAWYKKYSDGTLIQGGIITSNNTTLTFPQPFANTNYYVNVGAFANSKFGYGGTSFAYGTRLTTGLTDLTNSFGTQTISYRGWLKMGDNSTIEQTYKPHWLVMGEWK